VPRNAVALLVAVLATTALSATALAAASAPVAAASARQDRLSVGWNGDRGGSGSASARGFSPAAAGSALVGSAPVGNGPGFTAVDSATHTLYVTNGVQEDGNPDGGNTVSVIDTRHCQAADVSSCKGPWPTLTVGSDADANPSGVAIDQQTGTLYVAAAGDNTVAVFNSATCNAETSTGCGQKPAVVSLVPVGGLPIGIFDDPANHTLYIPNGAGDDLSMLDTATCNATDLKACPTTPPPTVTLPSEVTAGTVDSSTHTVYVSVCADANFGCPAGSDGVSVFAASTCNATVQSGCGQLGLIPTAVAPYGLQVDAANQTLYAASVVSTTTISAFDLRHCNAADLAGCASDTPGTVTPPGIGFGVVVWVAVDPSNHTVYVTSQKDDAVIVVNANVCNGGHLAGCATLHPPEIHTGSDPEVLTLDPGTQTLYTANQDDNDVSVIAATRCDAQTTTGCRQRVPEAPVGSEANVTADPAVATLYVANGGDTVAMLDTKRCNADSSAGCAAAPPTVKVGTDPQAVAIDPATHTVYVANAGAGTSGTVSVFDDRECNATDQAGCRSRSRTCPKSRRRSRRSERRRACKRAAVSTLKVPEGKPVGVAVNPSTDTVYVATITGGGGPNLISVFNGRTCNAGTRSGCGQKLANAPTGEDNDGDSTEAIAVNSKTNTIYATSGDTTGSPSFGDDVYMIDGATCDATHTAGCAKTPAVITLGSNPVVGDANPYGITVDQATDTIYTANLWDGEGPGTVSVINGATCNAQTSSGCDQTPAAAPAGFGSIAITLDPTTNRIYDTNIEDTSVTTINGNTCNATNHTGCNDGQTQPIVGDYPNSISLDPKVNTAYVADNEGISVMPLTP
jgi:DNA-binding beta-propeller fold protein YncE